MIEFSEWQIFLLSAVIGFFVALGFKYATVSKTWNDKRAVTSAVVSNAVLGAIYGVVVCAVAYLAGMVITVHYLSVFSYILITVVSGESLSKLLEKKVGQAIRIWLGFADEDEKDTIIKELRESNKRLNEELKKRSGEPVETEVEIPINAIQTDLSPTPDPSIDALPKKEIQEDEASSEEAIQTI